jgi:hypothetical protein
VDNLIAGAPTDTVVRVDDQPMIRVSDGDCPAVRMVMVKALPNLRNGAHLLPHLLGSNTTRTGAHSR